MNAHAHRNVYHVRSDRRTVRELPMRLRPREELDRLGIQQVSDSILLAVILRSGTAGHNVLDMATALIEKYGSLTALAATTVEELAHAPGIRGLGRVKAQVILAALELARRLNEETLPERPRISTPVDAARTLESRVRGLEREVFWVLMLDTGNRLRGRPLDITQGILDASLVHPREVFREAVRSASAAVVLAHNHPSGNPAPSAADIRITRQLVEAGKLMDIEVLDHIILAVDGGELVHVSLREEGLVDF